MKIKYYSEILNKDFETEEALNFAEKQKEREDREVKAKAEGKEARRKEVNDALNEAATAMAKYFERERKFEEDYGEISSDGLMFSFDGLKPSLFKVPPFSRLFGF